MNPRVCILLNSLDEFDFKEVMNRHLPPDLFEVTIAESFPQEASDYRLIIPWNYRKVIDDATRIGNIVVMHSSELPEGRGWAPIYHAFMEKKREYVISGIFAADEVDTGDIIIRARFSIEADYTATFVRGLDNELSLVLIRKILDQWPAGAPVGVRQTGLGTFRRRRRPADNEIDPSARLIDLLPHLRGVESPCPAFFFHEGAKYLVEVRPDARPRNPDPVTIEYPALNKAETWREWHDTP